MNQTRAFLIFAWLMVATLLWMEWSKDQTSPSQAILPTSSAVPAAGTPMTAGNPAIPVAGPTLGAPAGGATVSAAPVAAPVVNVVTDVLGVELDGGEVRRADLLRFPTTANDDSPRVRLLSQDPQNLFTARSTWMGSNGAPAPGIGDFRYVGPSGVLALRTGQSALEVPFEWTGANGVTIRRVFTFKRGQYVIGVRDTVTNAGALPWSGYVTRELRRVPRPVTGGGPMSPEQYSFQGAAWYSPADKYEKRKFEDFIDDGVLDKTVTGGWVAMVQHHFLAAWIPQPDQAALYALSTPESRYSIAANGPAFNVAPGASATTEGRLWVGPKLVNQMQATEVPGLKRAVDFSSYAMFAALAEGLFFVLDKIHSVVGNWGWAIVGLVLLLKLLLYPLSAAQYRSAAKLRKFQPRLQQLKERYGDDKQKYQVAMMELYKKEKINPVGGCLPLLIQMPIFLALYWMLSESVELRHAPWIGWITDLTAKDPFFVLPVLNIAIMWFTQKLNPTVGMDPMQQKMLQYMPLVFGVMFAFFPAGLVLYWVTNGALGLLQQWWMIRLYSGEAPAKSVTVK